MPRFVPNIYHLFVELPLRARFAAAAKIGADGVEYHFPWELPKKELKQLLQDNGIEFIYCVVPSDWSAGPTGLGAQPGREDEFREAADLALDYIFECNFHSINVGAGPMPPGEDCHRCIDTYLKNLDYISTQAKGHRCLFMIEAVAEQNVPDWPMHTMADAAEVVRALNHDKVRLVYDTHQLRLQEKGPIAPIMDEYWPLISYVQIGNAPGRHEPGVGEIDLLYLVEKAVKKGYTGPIGLELQPSKDSWSSLTWMNPYGYTVDPDNR